MVYKNLFFDLDDTLWAFSVNAQSTFFEMYQKHRYGRFFPSFEHFYQLYQQRNHQLWIDYAAGKVTKDEPVNTASAQAALDALPASDDY